MTTQQLAKDLGTKLYTTRKLLHKTQRQIANSTNSSQVNISNLEKGKDQSLFKKFYKILLWV